MANRRYETWQIAQADGRRIVLRPSFLTVLQRLGFTFICVLLVFATSIGYYQVWSVRTSRPQPAEPSQRERDVQRAAEQLERDAIESGLITEEEAHAIRERSEQRRAEQRAQRRDEILTYATWLEWGLAGAIGLFTFLGIVVPLSAYWERVTMRVDPYGRFIFKRRGPNLLTERIQAEPGTYTSILCCAQEQQRKRGQNTYETVGWMWNIAIQSIGGDQNIVFSLDMMKNRPMENAPPPGRVRRVADALSKNMRIPIVKEFPVLDFHSRRFGPMGNQATFISSSDPIVTTRVVNHDEMPPEMQDRLKSASGSPMSIRNKTVRNLSGDATVHEESNTSRKITYQAVDGTVYTYDSFDDMPPEVKAIYEKLQGD